MLINDLPIIIVKCMFYTALFETVFAYIIGVRKKKDVINVILINCLTNPFVSLVPVLFNIYVGITARNIMLLILEILTVLGEGLFYKKVLNYKKINPYLLSLILNGFSYLLGLVII